MLGFDASFRALADPTRRAILARLRDGSRFAGEIADALRLPANALSFHLRILREADLVHAERAGQYIRYTLNTSVVEDIARLLLDRLGSRPAGHEGSPAGPPPEATPPGPAVCDSADRPHGADASSSPARHPPLGGN